MLRRYNDRLAGWESRPDCGQTRTINLGFRRSASQVMGWLNSDDLLLPGAMARMATYFHRHPGSDIVYGHRVVIDGADREVGDRFSQPTPAAAHQWRDYIPQETMFWRPKLWDRIGDHLNEAYTFALDWELIQRFGRAGAQFACIDRYLGAFRTHYDQKSLAQRIPLGEVEFARIRAAYVGMGMTAFRSRFRCAMYLVRSVGSA